MSASRRVIARRLGLTANKFDMPPFEAHHRLASERQPAMHIQISEGIRSVLLVEDEGLVSMMMEDLLRELGVETVLVCGDLETALVAAASADIDCAVLDYHVRGGECGGVADILAGRDIPFIFSTGSGLDSLRERHRRRPIIAKPFADDDFKLLVLDTVARSRSALPGGPSAGRVATFTPTD